MSRYLAAAILILKIEAAKRRLPAELVRRINQIDQTNNLLRR